jgi:hypothetical protein
MLLRWIVAYHFPVYQTLVGLFGVIACLRILSPYSLPLCIGYGSVTVGSYWVGQGLVALVQRRRAKQSNSFD